jgi:hypothetical protein
VPLALLAFPAKKKEMADVIARFNPLVKRLAHLPSPPLDATGAYLPPRAPRLLKFPTKKMKRPLSLPSDIPTVSTRPTPAIEDLL